MWGTVELGPADDDWLVTDDTEVHVIDEGANVTYSKRLPTDWRPLKGCFYRGRVTDHRGPSMAVLSLCHGLVSCITFAHIFSSSLSRLTSSSSRDDSTLLFGSCLLLHVRLPSFLSRRS